MSNKAVINTEKAPAAIGPYSQAIKAGNTVYLSGQIPLDPDTMALVSDDFEAQARQVFANLQAVCEEAAGSLSDISDRKRFEAQLFAEKERAQVHQPSEHL